MPPVVLHNAVLAYENGDEFLQACYDAEQSKLGRFILAVEGSIGNEVISGDGHWSGLGMNARDGQPITTNEWIDRLAPLASAVLAIGTCATYGGIPGMKGNPTGAMGPPDFLGWRWQTRQGLPIVCLPGCPVQPDNATEVLLYLILHVAGMAQCVGRPRGGLRALHLRPGVPLLPQAQPAAEVRQRARLEATR